MVTKLPRLPKKRPMAIKKSSCNIDSLIAVPTTQVSSNSTSREELYENRDDFWTEVDEFNDFEAKQVENESESTGYQQQDGNIYTS